jgi:hypothetical protein
MTIEASTTMRELAFIVCTALDYAGVKVVLTGGGAATVYVPQARCRIPVRSRGRSRHRTTYLSAQ